MRRFRILIIGLVLILLLAAPTLASRTSDQTPVFLGKYSLRYGLLLTAYALGLVGLAITAALARPGLRDATARLANWVQRYPLIYLALGLIFIEIWYALRDLLNTTLFTDSHIITVLGFSGNADSLPLLWSAALLMAYVLLVLMFFERRNMREFGVNIALAGFSGLVTFVVAAYIYTLFFNADGYRQVHDTWGRLVERDRRYGYRMKSNLQDFEMWEGGGTSNTISTDALGFRNAIDITGAPLAIVGDSYTMGLGVNDDQTWSHYLVTERGIQAANYGTPGYALWQYNQVVEDFAAANDHRVIIYNIFANDLINESDLAADPRIVYDRQIRPFRSPVNWSIWLLGKQSPVSHMLDVVKRIQAGPPDSRSNPDLPSGLPPECINWAWSVDQDYIFSMMDRAIELAEAHDYVLMFTTLPSTLSTYYEEMAPYCRDVVQGSAQRERRTYERICEYAASQGVPCYNLTEDMRAAASTSPQPLYLTYDTHLSETGHQVFADFVIEFVEDNGIDLTPED